VPGPPVSDLRAAGSDGPRAGTASQHKAARTAPAATAGEGAALTGSTVASAMCGALAGVWGVLSGARIILFDGAYALLGIGMAGLSLRIAHAVAARADVPVTFGPRRPHSDDGGRPGRRARGTLFYAGADAVAVIHEGGTPVAPGDVVTTAPSPG
jgi:hypothetical protein